jgi:Xaa-Pro aminopeptidase
MLATLAEAPPSVSELELVELYKDQVTKRGLVYEYSLLTTGLKLNRAPSVRQWSDGDVLSLDSGAEFHGYIGDLTRMAVRGSPTARMQEVLEEVDAIQAAALRPIRAGEVANSIYESALAEMGHITDDKFALFEAHGMGLTSHEAPRLTSRAPMGYLATHAQRPLEAGMVLSLETTIRDPAVGFVKLEDTVFVTRDGWEAPGFEARGWNLARAEPPKKAPPISTAVGGN